MAATQTQSWLDEETAISHADIQSETATTFPFDCSQCILSWILYTTCIERPPFFLPYYCARVATSASISTKKKSMPVTTICWVSSKYHGDTHTYINRGGITLFPLASSVPWTPTPPDAVVLDAFPMVRPRILFFVPSLFLPVYCQCSFFASPP